MPAIPQFKPWKTGHHAASLAFLVILCALIYSNTLNSPFLWDERVFLLDNPIVRDLSFYYTPSRAAGGQEGALLDRRYIGYLSFALNYRLHGYEVTGYHIVNTAVHILAAWLVYALGFAISLSSRMKDSVNARTGGLAALLGAAVFAAHPVQTEAVTYIFQRLASMSAMFYLFSVAAYAYARMGVRGPARASLYLLSILSALLAMKTKESAFTLPLAILLYEIAFHQGSWQSRARWLVPYAPLLLVIPLSISGTADSAAGNYLTLSASQEGYSAYQYLITQSRVIVTYIRMLLIPVGQNLDHDYPLYRSALEPAVLASSALLLALLASGIEALRRFRSKGAALLGVYGFGILWFMLTLSVESSIIPIPMLIDEYRMYLPSAGLCLAFSFFIIPAAVRSKGQTAVILVFICIAIPVALGATAYKRNSLWQSRITLWEDVIKKSPYKLRGYNNLANAYADAGMRGKATLTYESALRPEVSGSATSRELGELHYNLAGAYAAEEIHEKAIEHFQSSISLMPLNADAHNNLGLSLLALGRTQEAVGAYYGALRAREGYTNAYFNLGEAYHMMYLDGVSKDNSLLQRAIANYEIFITLRPEFPQAHLNLSRAYKDKENLQKAADHLRYYESLINSHAGPGNR